TITMSDWKQFATDAGLEADWVLEEVTTIWKGAPELILQEIQDHKAPARIFNPVAQLFDTLPGRL
ncbi:hypothetical protein, partial [Corynebacterium durum]